MNIAYVHTGKWPSNSPSITFATYNCISIAQVTDHCYFFIKQNSTRSVEAVLQDFFQLSPPENLTICQNRSVLKSNYLYYLKILLQIKKLHKRKKLDAVISRSITFLPFLKKIKQTMNIPVIFEAHDFFTDLALRTDINIKKKAKQQRLERKYINYLDGLICLQNEQKKLYEKYYSGLSIRVIRTGIHKLNRSSKSRKYITYVGSFDLLKGVDILIDSLKYLKSQPEILLIGGKSQSEIQKLEKKISIKYPCKKIIITGWINKKKLDNYLSETLIGIIPLKNTFFNRYLTSPLKLFDYFSSGIPIIASDLPANRELIDENVTGIFFESDNPKKLAEKIDELIQNENNRKNMEKNIYLKATSLLWEKRAEQIIAFVNELKGR